MIELDRFWGTVTELDIARFEKRNGLMLPKSYRRFLREHNGGRPKNGELPVPDWGVTVVDFFFGIDTGNSYDLQRQIDRLEHPRSSDLIAIASDPGGWMIYLAVSGPHEGGVYFWDHKTAGTKPVLIGGDFESFSNSLAPDGTYDDYEFGRPPKQS